MKKPVPIEWPSMTGGVNQENPASAIGDNELSMAVNFKPRPPIIRSRGGLRRLVQFLAPNGAAELILGIKSALRGGSKGILLLGQTHSSWYPADFANPTSIGIVGPSSGVTPWSVAAWNEAVFAAREEDGLRLVQLDPDSVSSGGQDAPTAAPVATDGGAGQLTAADYSWRHAWKDSRMGTVTSMGPVSNTLSLAADHDAHLEFSDSPPHARFDIRVIYRTLPDGTGAWLKVDEIDSALTSYDDDIPIEGQSDLGEEDNDAPPDDARSVVSWQSRLWVHDGTQLYPSKIGNPEAFSPDEVLKIGDDDTEEIVEILATKDRLIVGKRRSIWSLTGTGATSWSRRRIDPEHGVAALRSLVESGNMIIWQSDDDYYMSDGQTPGIPLSGVGRRKLKPFFQARTPGMPSVSASVPGSDGVLLGLNSRVVVKELVTADEEEDTPDAP